MAIVLRSFVDYWSPDGVLRLQDAGPLSSTAITGTINGAKTDGLNNHYVYFSDATNSFLNMARLNTGDTLGGGGPPAYALVTSSAQTKLNTVAGMAKDDNNDFYFVDYSPTPNQVYRLSHNLETVDDIANVATMDTTTPPYQGIAFCDRLFALGGAGRDAFSNAVSLYRSVEGGTWTQVRNLASAASPGIKAIAWNGRDLLFVSQGLVTPPTGYDLYVLRTIGGASGNGLSYLLGTRGSFPSADGGNWGVVDADWDGRNWLVYTAQYINLGA